MTDALFNLNTLTPAQLASVVSQLNAMNAAEDARKQSTAVKIAQDVVSEFTPGEFKSGAVGVHLNGAGNVTLPDGTVENWTVSVLVRRTASIPARKSKNAVTTSKIGDAIEPGSDETP